MYVEAVRTRHQELSDYPSLLHFVLRFFCMAGHRNPHATHAQQASLAIGFLALVGALSPGPSNSNLNQNCKRVRQLVLTELGVPMENTAEEAVEDQEYLMHGAVVPSGWVEAQVAADAAAQNPIEELRLKPGGRSNELV